MGALNADLEDIFGISMSVIRKRADQIWKVLEASEDIYLSPSECGRFMLEHKYGARRK